MKLKNLFFAALSLIAFALPFNSIAQNFKVDNSKTTIEWEGKKVTGAHNGLVKIKEGNFYVLNGSIFKGEFIVDMTSITCTDISDPKTNEKLVGHLKSDDFFGVDNFPEAKLVIEKGEHVDMNNHRLSGDITIKGVTVPVEFDAEMSTEGSNVVAKAKLTIDRSKFNIKYGSGSFFSNLGDRMIYDDFHLTINFTATPAKN